MTATYLHFLNGPLTHQSLLLPDGTLVIGRHNDSDVYFELDSSNEMFELHHVHGEVYMISDNEYTVDGNSPVSRDSSLPLNSIIQVGGCFFLLGPETITSYPTVTYSSSSEGERKKNSIAYMYTVVSSLIALALLILLFYIIFSHKVDEQTKENTIHDLIIKQQKEHLPDLRLTWNGDHQVDLSGYYKSREVLMPVITMMKRHNIRFNLRAYNDEDIKESVVYLARRQGFDKLIVQSGDKPGSVSLSGMIVADETWRVFLKDLQSVDGLKRWSLQNISMLKTADLLLVVKKLKLLSKVSIERDKQSFTITGVLTEEQKRDLSKEVLKLTGGEPDKIIFQNMNPVSPGESIFPSPVVSIGGGKNNEFVELLDGRRMQSGARLENNYEIIAIDPKSGIDLLGDDNLLHYNFSF